MKTTKCGGGKIYQIPMGDIEYIGYFLADKKKETVKAANARIGKLRGRVPDVIINAELFDFGSRAPASDVVENGAVHRLTEGYGIAFPNNKTAVFTYKNGVRAGDYVGAYPVLVRSRNCEKSVPGGLGGSRGRTAIGIGDGGFYVAIVPDSKGVTLDKLRSSLKSAGVFDAINLDGGGSTQGYAFGDKYTSSRPVRGFIAVWVKGDYRKVSVKTSLNVRSGAGILYKKVGTYYNGDVVQVLEEKSGWCRTALGWVSNKYLVKER